MLRVALSHRRTAAAGAVQRSLSSRDVKDRFKPAFWKGEPSRRHPDHGRRAAPSLSGMCTDASCSVTKGNGKHAGSSRRRCVRFPQRSRCRRPQHPATYSATANDGRLCALSGAAPVSAKLGAGRTSPEHCRVLTRRDGFEPPGGRHRTKLSGHRLDRGIFGSDRDPLASGGAAGWRTQR